MESMEIINALKNGNIPNDNVMQFCVGRENQINEFKNLLNYVEAGNASTKFINGEFGAGKSFFLKVIEELAYKDNFVVSRITIGDNLPFHKIDMVYKEIAKSLKCKTGTSLNHIIDRWITRLKVEAEDEVDDEEDIETINLLVEEQLEEDLMDTRDCSNPFATAVESYYRAKEEGDKQTANYAQSWLRGDSNIPFTEKRKFGVKGGVDKENAFHFLTALATFIKSVGYSGLVILIDEAEFIMKTPLQKSRDSAYNYIRDIFDGCSNGTFTNLLFVFAGTYQFFEDDQKGIRSYEALYSRIQNAVESDYENVRTPIINLTGFDQNNAKELANTIIEIHKDTYNWDTSIVESNLDLFIEKHIENSGLTGGYIVPRDFIREFVEILDTIEQNQSELNNNEKISELFASEENITTQEEDDLYDDW